jgi:hypothetical protein
MSNFRTVPVAGCPETSLRYYHPTLRIIPEERGSQVSTLFAVRTRIWAEEVWAAVQMKMSMAQGCSYEVALANNNTQPLLTIQTLCIVTSPVLRKRNNTWEREWPVTVRKCSAQKSAKLDCCSGIFGPVSSYITLSAFPLQTSPVPPPKASRNDMARKGFSLC